MKFRYLAIAALALFLPVFATSCGDDSTGDLSESEISKEFQDAGIPEEQADCMAGKVKDADLTKEELDDFTESQDESSKAGKALMSAVTSCMAAATDN
ncbi:hypothetical protein ACE2AJ_13020 [Aquihabitans daechungensis]|uniref:hypothetical protein n=1 Tax=Aquihabitans daechungensis TaxID=1052257 RepID=UPI003B9F2892